MEKFLQNNKLTKDEYNGREFFRIEVKDQSDVLIDELVCYCIFDVQRVTAFYLKPEGRFWYTVKTTKL